MTAHDPTGMPPPTPPLVPPPPTPPNIPAPPSPPTLPAPERPWWGVGDVLLGVLFVLFVSGLVTLPFIIWAVIQNNGEIDSTASTSIPIIGVGAGLITQQLATGVWPVWVAHWKGFGAKHDFGLDFRPIDLLSGFFTGLGLMLLAALAGAATSALVGLENAQEASNTALLTDNRDSPIIYLIIFAVVVGAPVSEELFFRGLVLRAVEKRWNVPLAVLVSTILFTAVHYTGASLRGTAVLFASIGVLGAGLALLTVRTNRLGSPMMAHATINAVAVLAELFA